MSDVRLWDWWDWCRVPQEAAEEQDGVDPEAQTQKTPQKTPPKARFSRHAPNISKLRGFIIKVYQC